MTDKEFIKITDLTRKFKETIALDSINLTIQEGELFGLVGPDGAGKTTLLRTLAGLLGISSGEVRAAGCELHKNTETIKSKIGYMAQEFSLYGKLSVLENLQFFGEMYDVPPALQKERIPGLLAFAQLTDFTNRRAAKLSGGMKKKLALACTLLHQPPILLLDEPTTGVDPVSRREFWNILNDLHLDGTTIIVSTPYMDEADRCSRVGLIYQGRIAICDSPENIRQKIEGEFIKIVTNDWQKAREVIHPIKGVLEVQSYGEALHILVDSSTKRLGQIQKTLQKNKLEIMEIRVIKPRMEEAFISLIRKMGQTN
ncbi:MAG: ABC transporter ATP-binding protein [Chloroflexota bacterium]|nr:MAG: ABC transporter ATP-binding protein [Chloroflexota bacterium]